MCIHNCTLNELSDYTVAPKLHYHALLDSAG